MALAGWPKISVTELRGAWSRLVDKTARPNRAFVARNVRYGPEGVRSRDDFSATAISVSGKATSFYNWVGNGLNRLIYVAGGAAVRMLNVSTAADVSLFSVACRGCTVAEAGDKALIATHTTAGAGAAQVRISLPLIGGGSIDKAFPAPWTTALTMADNGAGNCTAGPALFGYVVESRTGYTGKPTAATASFTASAGGRALRGTMTVTVPADAAIVHPIRTRTDNPDKWYYEPGASVAVPGGAVGWGVTVDFNTSDESLEASATEVDIEFDYLTQDGAGAGPITPHCVALYGKRAVYLTPHRAYVSEPGDYQAITEALHGLELPGRRQMTTAFQFRQSLYILGPGWTYEVADNGDYPATWANATEISSAIGTPAIQGICSKTAGDYVWIASESGLYLFNGSYSRLPVSYMNNDWWERINWAVPQSLIVVDNFIDKRLIVAAPIDDATEPSHMLVWDYARGLGPMDVDFAYYDFSISTFSALGLVKNTTTGEIELWRGPSASGAISKETAGAAPDQIQQWESGHLIQQTGPRKWYRLGGVDLEISGTGTAGGEIAVMDHSISGAGTSNITLAAAPGETYRELVDLTSENFSVRITVPPASKFELNGIVAHVKPWLGHR
jgi:hypothetical protein